MTNYDILEAECIEIAKIAKVESDAVLIKEQQDTYRKVKEEIGIVEILDFPRVSVCGIMGNVTGGSGIRMLVIDNNGDIRDSFYWVETKKDLGMYLINTPVKSRAYNSKRK